MSDLSHVLFNILNSTHIDTEFLFLVRALLFLAFAREEPLHGMFSLSTPGDYPTTFKIQIKQALNVKLSLSCVDRAHHPGLLEYDTPSPHVCCHPSVLLCVYIPMSSSRAEALSDSYLQPSCPTPVLNKCLMND